MNKDLLVASSIGFGLGLIAAIMLWVVPRMMPKNVISDKKPDTAISETVSQASPATSGPLTLEVIDGTVVESADFSVKGKANDATLVIVATPTSYEAVTPNESGAFDTEIELSKGANHIAVTSYNDTQTTTQEVDVFYYPEKI